VNESDITVPNKQQQEEDSGGNDPWGETPSFVDSFAYSMSNEESVEQGIDNTSLLQEKKNGSDDILPKNQEDYPQAAIVLLDDPNPTMVVWNDGHENNDTRGNAAFVWNDGQNNIDRRGNAVATVAPLVHPLKQQQQQQHPLMSTQPQQQQQQKQVAHSKPAIAPPTTTSANHNRNHRRLNSSGSASSSRKNKSGGSVGSSSSAVDQILEHYRQKRRGKDKVSSKAVGSRGINSIAMASMPNNGGGGSVHSGVSVSPGSIATAPNAAGVAAAVHHGHANNRHRRNPSSESVSRIIDNLENTAAAAAPTGIPSKAATTTANSTATATALGTPSPIVGKKKYYNPPIMNQNGQSFANVVSSGGNHHGSNGSSNDDIAADHQFLLANIEATIGPRGVAPDMESLSGRSQSTRGRGRQHHQQNQQQRSHSSRPSSSVHGSNNNNRRSHRSRDAASVDSRTSRASRASRTSFRTYQSTRSALTSMSKETQSVANDLFRLEAQLAEQVARHQRQQDDEDGTGAPAAAATAGGSTSTRSVTGLLSPSSSLENITFSTSGSGELGSNNNTSTLGAAPVPRGPTPFEIIAPPGKLGILLSNTPKSSLVGGLHSTTTTQHDGSSSSSSSSFRAVGSNRGLAHVSAVRSESVLAGKVHVGDIFVSIDGEDVTQMNPKEITNVMARKAEFERVLKFRPLVSNSMLLRQEWI